MSLVFITSLRGQYLNNITIQILAALIQKAFRRLMTLEKMNTAMCYEILQKPFNNLLFYYLRYDSV